MILPDALLNTPSPVDCDERECWPLACLSATALAAAAAAAATGPAEVMNDGRNFFKSENDDDLGLLLANCAAWLPIFLWATPDAMVAAAAASEALLSLSLAGEDEELEALSAPLLTGVAACDGEDWDEDSVESGPAGALLYEFVAFNWYLS